MRAALYSRISVSDERVDKASNQLADCRTLCERVGYEVVAEFADDGLSAFKDDVDRPGFNQLLALIESGGCDVVVAVALDRLSRRPVDSLKLQALCASAGVKTHTVSEGQQSEDADSAELLSFLAGWRGAREVRSNQERQARANATKRAKGLPAAGGARSATWTTRSRLIRRKLTL